MSATTESIAHYNLLERIGAGGLGDVYRARDTKVGRTVALKVLPDKLARDLAHDERFKAAVREAATLSHPNVATLFEAAEHAGRRYFAYEFVSGITLRQEIAGRPVNPRRALELAIQIADALADAHAREIVHGDLRPETIMVTAKGSARILDFGLGPWTRGGAARAAAAASPDRLTPEAAAVAPYLSPEQALGGSIDARSDLFSLGVVLYEMLTGRSPFALAPPGSPVFNVIRSTPVRPSEVNSSLPPDVDAIVMRALSKGLDSRYQSAVSFAAELRSIAAVLDVRSGDNTAGELIQLEEDRGGPLWIAVLLIALVAGAAVWYFL
jgi:eukaryotic-like serine/threonine-protein kinase